MICANASDFPIDYDICIQTTVLQDLCTPRYLYSLGRSILRITHSTIQYIYLYVYMNSYNSCTRVLYIVQYQVDSTTRLATFRALLHAFMTQALWLMLMP